MPEVPTRAPDELSAALKDIRPDDIDSEWLDDMVKRLFKELRRQLSQIESTKPQDDDTKNAAVRAANVRALSGIERTLERLARLEQQRALSRETKIRARNGEHRAELERRLDQLLAAGNAPGIPETPE